MYVQRVIYGRLLTDYVRPTVPTLETQVLINLAPRKRPIIKMAAEGQPNSYVPSLCEHSFTKSERLCETDLSDSRPLKYGVLVPIAVIYVTADGVAEMASVGYTRSKDAVSKQITASRERRLLRRVS